MEIKKSVLTGCRIGGFILLACLTVDAGVIHVDAGAAGAGSGASWTDAFVDLQPAIDSAGEGDEVWVAEGTYKPTSWPKGGSSEREKHFSLKYKVAVLGGFAGFETCRFQRDFRANPTVLSGNIGDPEKSTDNCYHVFYHPSGIYTDSVLDGFTVTGGHANADPFRDSAHNLGGGMYSNIWWREMSILNCVFTGNYAERGGGAIFNANHTSPLIFNCVFDHNSGARGWGGAIHNSGGEGTRIVNCLFYANNAFRGGAIGCWDSSMDVINCVMFNNTMSTDVGGSAIYAETQPGSGGGGKVVNSILWGNTPGIQINTMSQLSTSYTIISDTYHSGEHIVTTDPMFFNPDDPVGPDGIWGTDDDGLRVSPESPGVNYGDNAAFSSSWGAYDLSGAARIQGGTIDFGPYEYGTVSYFHTITATAGANGLIDPIGTVTLPQGVNQTFDIFPDEGHHVTDVLVDGSSLGAVTSHTFENVHDDHSISASFAIDTYTIVASAGENGSISPDGEITVEHGSEHTFTITPDPDYRIAYVVVDGSRAGHEPTYTFSDITANHTIEAVFELDLPSHTILATTQGDGSIFPVGEVEVRDGDGRAFIITPDEGRHIVDVLVDGTSVGPVDSYNFDNVVADHTIEALFAIDTYTITASAGDNGSISPSGGIIVEYGSDQTFTITPDDGYHVADVIIDGECGGAITSHTFTGVNSDHTIEATFISHPIIIYVKHDAAGANDGTSWEDAFNELQPAIDAAKTNYPVWVAAGTYKPTSWPNGGEGEREKHFSLKNGVAVYGGFNGTETALQQRDIHVNQTILSGDIGIPDDSADNCYHVFHHFNGIGLDGTAVLDGFTITAGFADGGDNHGDGSGIRNHLSSPRIANCLFIKNAASNGGGGIANFGSSPFVVDCVFADNSVNGYGGGIYNGEGNPVIVNCLFINNLSSSGAIGCWNSNCGIVNCLIFSNNTGIYNSGYVGCGPTVANSIIWGNKWSPQIQDSCCGVKIQNVIVQDGFDGASQANPEFINPADPIGPDGIWATADDGLRLSPGSPAINSGANSAVPAGVTTDLIGKARIQGGTVDLGPYEFCANTITATATGPGSISPNGEITVLDGYYQLFSITPDEGCHITDVLVDGSSVGAATAHTFTNVTGDHTIEALFAINTYTVTASAGDNGSISPSGGIVLEHGSSQAFTITPDPGHHIADVVVDGVSQGSIVNYNFANITAEHTIEAVFAPGASPVIYVKHDAEGANDGSSWRDAFTELQPAIDAAKNNYSVWVAAGTYKPTSWPNGGGSEREKHFSLKNAVAVYGGFNGTESSIGERDSTANPTILSGDIGTPGYSADNCCHVFHHPGISLNNSAILDGFTITAGYAGGMGEDHSNGAGMLNVNSSPWLVDCVFTGNAATAGGGGIGNFDSTPYILDCVFDSNSAGGWGGGIVNINCYHSKTVNCVFVKNTATHGAGVACWLSYIRATNCVFYLNQATITGGAAYIAGSSMDACNSIVWGDKPNELAEGEGSGIDVSNCIVQGGYPGKAVIDSYPLFFDVGRPIGADGIWRTADDGLQLTADSPAMNFGDNSFIAGTKSDILGNLRIQDGTVDLGPYEFGSNPSKHVITATAGANGVIEPGGKVMVEYGGAQTFAIRACEYYHIADVRVDGESVGAVDSYSFENVTTDHTIAASFERDKVALIMRVSPAGVGGSTDPAVGTTAVAKGEELIITAAPAEGMRFVGWKALPEANVVFLQTSSEGDGDLGAVGATKARVILKSDAAITAKFAPIEPTAILTMAISEYQGGTTSPTAGVPEEVATLTPIDISISTRTGYMFLGWTAEPVQNAVFENERGNNTKVTLLASANIIAKVKFIPVLAVNFPEGEGVLKAGQACEITWNPDEFEGDEVRIDLCKQDMPHSTITPETLNDGSYIWDAPSPADAGNFYKIRISSLADPAACFETWNYFSITISGATITVAAPAPDDIVETGAATEITWSSNDVEGDLRIDLCRAGLVIANLAESETNDGACPWTPSGELVPGGGYTVKVSGVDGDGIEVKGGSGGFVIVPGDGGTAVLSMAASPEGAGTLAPVEGEAVVAAGETMIITAEALYGYSFCGWKAEPAENCAVEDRNSPITGLSVYGDCVVTACFIDSLQGFQAFDPARSKVTVKIGDPERRKDSVVIRRGMLPEYLDKPSPGDAVTIMLDDWTLDLSEGFKERGDSVVFKGETKPSYGAGFRPAAANAGDEAIESFGRYKLTLNFRKLEWNLRVSGTDMTTNSPIETSDGLDVVLNVNGLPIGGTLETDDTLKWRFDSSSDSSGKLDTDGWDWTGFAIDKAKGAKGGNRPSKDRFKVSKACGDDIPFDSAVDQVLFSLDDYEIQLGADSLVPAWGTIGHRHVFRGGVDDAKVRFTLDLSRQPATWSINLSNADFSGYVDASDGLDVKLAVGDYEGGLKLDAVQERTIRYPKRR